MLRRLTAGCAALVAACLLSLAQPAAAPVWKVFSLGPARRVRVPQPNNVRLGALHADSISLKTLVSVATGVPWVRIVGPSWMDREHYSLAAELADESRLRFRTRAPDDPHVADEFRMLLTRELEERFRLEFHREIRDLREYTLEPAGELVLAPRGSTARERGRVNVSSSALARDTTFDARNVPYRSLANWLQEQFQAPVKVAPSLPSGSYDFHLKWKTGDLPSLIAALKDQLGLELAGETRPEEFLVIDRLERPAIPSKETLTARVPTPAPDSQVTFTPAQLRRDLRVLRESLEEGHPGLYRYTPKPELDRLFDATAAQLTRPLTALQFYRVLAPVVARIKCGHTALRPAASTQQRVAAEPLLPFEIAVLDGRVFVARDFSEEGNLAGAELVSINGRAVDGILGSMLAVVHGDGDSATAGPYRLSHERGFARNLYLIAGLQSPFRVRYALDGKAAVTPVTGMTLRAMRAAERNRYPAAPRAGNATWRLIDGGSTGVLKIASFEGAAEDGTPMAAFFERVFTEAHQKHVAKLILDVRDNGGGEDELGRKLFAYFADGPFRYYRDLVLNALSFRFSQYVRLDPLPPNIRELVTAGADRKYHFVGHPNWGMGQPADPHFGGRLVVLMNGGSFSATCEFLSTLHHRGGATFVGEETAGGYYGNTSGAAASVLLPHSRLVLPVQLVGYYMAIEGNAQGAHGVRPDYPVEYTIGDILAGRDKAMEAALRLCGDEASR